MFKKDFKFFDVAKAVSKTSSYNAYKIGAVIVNKKEIISVGCNVKKTHPMQKKLNPLRYSNWDDVSPKLHHFLHAEMSAIIHSDNKDLSKMSIYVYRETKEGKMANSRPCNACMQALREKGIKRIFYTTPYGFCEETLI